MQFSCWVAGHLTGGLGNRLFQHAAAAGLAEKWNVPLVFYLPECTETGHGPFENIFKLFPTLPKLTAPVPVHRIPEAFHGVFTYEPFQEKPSHPFNSVDGWRQSELYFPKKGLKPSFDTVFSKEQQDELLCLYNMNTEDTRRTTWFIHVRLGDYKILPHHQIDLNDYYSKAIQHVPKLAKILLFCDEIDQFGATFQEYFQKLGYTVMPVKHLDELETLFLMSQCWGGAIVANSTFSWWGAYFAHLSHPEPSKYTALYPSIWGKGLPEAKDVVPSWGIRIQNAKN